MFVRFLYSYSVLTSSKCYNYVGEIWTELDEITSAPGGIRMAARA